MNSMSSLERSNKNISKAIGLDEKVIGHTHTGKPIMGRFDHPAHAEFTAEEHHVAACMNDTLAAERRMDAVMIFNPESESKAFRAAESRHNSLNTAHGAKARAMNPDAWKVCWKGSLRATPAI